MAWPVTKAPGCRCAWGQRRGASDPGGPRASLRRPREEARKQAGRAPGFVRRVAADRRAVQKRGGRVANPTAALFGSPAKPRQGGCERGPASPAGDAAQQHPPRRHRPRVAMRDRLGEALPRTRISRARRRAHREAEPRAGGHGLGDGGRAARGARGSRRRSAPPCPWRAPGQGSCPTRRCRGPPSRPRAPSPAAECEASARRVLLRLGALSAAPRGSAPRGGCLPRPPRCKAARTGSARDSAGAGGGAAAPHGAERTHRR